MHPNRLPYGVQEGRGKTSNGEHLRHPRLRSRYHDLVVAGTVKRLREKGYTVTGEFTDEGGYRMSVTGAPE